MILARTYRLGLTLAAFSTALAPRVAGAPLPGQIGYQIQPILKLGDPLGTTRLGPPGGLVVRGLASDGQVLFFLSSGSGDAVVEYSAGQFIPIAVSGGAAPGGTWPAYWTLPLPYSSPGSINQSGTVAFAVEDLNRSQALGLFVWDGTKRQVTPAVLPGATATNGAVLGAGPGWLYAWISNDGEIAFSAPVNRGEGLFLRDQSGKLTVVALGPISGASVGDQGVVAFAAGGYAQGLGPLPFLWENGTTTPLDPGRRPATDGKTIASFDDLWVNNANQTVLARVGVVVGTFNGPRGPEPLVDPALYRYAGGQWMPALVRGQAMPGGGTASGLLSTLLGGPTAVSASNEAGQYADLTELQDGGLTSLGAYLLDAEGRLSLIVRDGMTTAQGEVIHIFPTGTSNGIFLLDTISLNNQGQVALPLRVGSGPPMVALLTPAGP